MQVIMKPYKCFFGFVKASTSTIYQYGILIISADVHPGWNYYRQLKSLKQQWQGPENCKDPANFKNHSNSQGGQSCRVSLSESFCKTHSSFWISVPRRVSISSSILSEWSICFYWITRLFRAVEDFGVIYLGSASFKIARLLFVAMFSVHLFACIFFRVKIVSATSPEDVSSFYTSRNVAEDVSNLFNVLQFFVLRHYQVWFVLNLMAQNLGQQYVSIAIIIRSLSSLSMHVSVWPKF